jgi:hypothetical protein
MKGDDLTRVEVRSGYLKNDGTMVHPKTPPHYTYDVLAVVLRDNRVVYVDRHGSEWSP